MGLLSLLLSYLGPQEYCQQPSQRPWQPPSQVSPVSEQVVVIVAAHGPTPTALGPVHTGGVDGAAVDHGAGHPGCRRRWSGDNGVRRDCITHLPAPWQTQPPQSHWSLLSHKSSALKPSPYAGAASLEGSTAVHTPTSRVPGPICCQGPTNPKVRTWVLLTPVPLGPAHHGCRS